MQHFQLIDTSSELQYFLSKKKKKSGHQHICLYLEINTIFESSQRNRPAKQFPTLDSALRFCTVPNPR